MPYDASTIQNFFDGYGEREWERFELRAQDSVGLQIHTHYLKRFIAPGMHVLDAGAGPGRFTIELAKAGASITVLDLSDEMLKQNHQRMREAGLEQAVVAREQGDVTDLSRYPENTFDAVLCYGGPISYAMERADDAVAELLRVAKPGAPLLLSVMSVVGSMRVFLEAAVALKARFGPSSVEDIIETGLLTEEVQGNQHVMKMYRWEELEELLMRHPCTIEVASASNFLTAGRQETRRELVEDEADWDALLDWELRCCREKGALDGGTHILSVVRKH